MSFLNVIERQLKTRLIWAHSAALAWARGSIFKDKWAYLEAMSAHDRIALSPSDALENQATVGATEAEIVFECVFHLHVPSSVRTVVQVAVWPLTEDIDGGG